MALPNHRDLKYSFFFLQRNLVIVFQFQVIEHSFTATRNLNTSCFVGFDVFFFFCFFFSFLWAHISSTTLRVVGRQALVCMTEESNYGSDGHLVFSDHEAPFCCFFSRHYFGYMPSAFEEGVSISFDTMSQTFKPIYGACAHKIAFGQFHLRSSYFRQKSRIVLCRTCSYVH